MTQLVRYLQLEFPKWICRSAMFSILLHHLSQTKLFVTFCTSYQILLMIRGHPAVETTDNWRTPMLAARYAIARLRRPLRAPTDKQCRNDKAPPGER